MKAIRGVKVRNKTVLVRVDFNVAIDKNGKILDDFRIKESLTTINYLIKNKAKIILMSHLGRPDPNSKTDKKKFSLRPIAEYIQNEFDLKIKFINDCVGDEVKKEVNNLKVGQIVLLENLRFHPEEEKNDFQFSKKLAELADVYINDAFGASHRPHASILGVTKFLPSFAGFLLKKEVKILTKVARNPRKPAVAIVGGAKLETKLPLIQSLVKRYDYILIGGKIGLELRNKNKKIILPIDYRDKNRYDIGDKTVLMFKEIINKAKTIIWNGPMGMFENKRFGRGTEEIGMAIAKSKTFKVAGGGDTIAALNKYKLFDTINFVSTGGGAMLEFLSGKKMPGIEALKKVKSQKSKVKI